MTDLNILKMWGDERIYNTFSVLNVRFVAKNIPPLHLSWNTGKKNGAGINSYVATTLRENR